jgi:hypothetical protein
MFIFASLYPIFTFDVFKWGGCSSLGRIPSPRAAGTSLLLPAEDIDGFELLQQGDVSISFALFFNSPELTFHPVIRLPITFGQGKRKPLSNPTSHLASSFSFASKEREKTCGKLCIYGNGTSFDETVSLTTIPVNMQCNNLEDVKEAKALGDGGSYLGFRR